MAAGTATPFSSADRMESLSDQPPSHAAAPPPYPDGRSQRSQARVGAGVGVGVGVHGAGVQQSGFCLALLPEPCLPVQRGTLAALRAKTVWGDREDRTHVFRLLQPSGLIFSLKWFMRYFKATVLN